MENRTDYKNENMSCVVKEMLFKTKFLETLVEAKHKIHGHISTTNINDTTSLSAMHISNGTYNTFKYNTTINPIGELYICQIIYINELKTKNR